MPLIFTLARNLLLTVILEGIPVALIFRRWREIRCCILVNVMTNPALNFLVLVLCGPLALPYWPVTAVLEGSAVAAEAWGYRSVCENLSRARAVLLSAGLNALSFGVGLLLSR